MTDILHSYWFNLHSYWFVVAIISKTEYFWDINRQSSLSFLKTIKHALPFIPKSIALLKYRKPSPSFNSLFNKKRGIRWMPLPYFIMILMIKLNPPTRIKRL